MWVELRTAQPAMMTMKSPPIAVTTPVMAQHLTQPICRFRSSTELLLQQIAKPTTRAGTDRRRFGRTMKPRKISTHPAIMMPLAALSGDSLRPHIAGVCEAEREEGV